MKKLLTTLATVGLAAAAFAQGTVNWSGVGSLFIAQTNGTVYSSFGANGGQATLGGTIGNTAGNTAANDTALGYSGFYYELLVGSSATAPTTAAGFAGWVDTTLGATNGAVSNGRIVQTAAGGAGGIAGNTQAAATGWLPGVTTNIIMVGWSANLGSSWSTVLGELQNWSTEGIANAYFGVSTVGSLAGGNANPGVSIFGANAGQINNPAGSPMELELLGTVPEPGTVALAIMGASSLLMLRRKK